MTTQDAGGIRVRILGDDSDLQQKLRDSGTAVVKWGAAAAAATGAVALTARSAEAALELENLAYLSGLTTEKFKKQAAAARTVGIQNDKLADIFKDVSDKVGDFMQTGAGPMADFFENIGPKVGVTTDEFKKLNGADALQLYVSSLEKANLSQSEMTFYMEAIASDSTALIPLMKNNGKAMNEAADRAERLGIVLSNIDTAQLSQTGKTFDEVGQVIDGITNRMSAEMSPIIKAIADQFLDAAEDTGGFQGAIETAFNIAIKGAGFVANAIRGIQVVVKGLEVAFWGLNAGVSIITNEIIQAFDQMNQDVLGVVNSMINGVNNIPGVNIENLIVGQSEFAAEAEAMTQEAKDKVSAVLGEMHDLLMEPLPSQVLTDWAAEVKAKADEAAAAQVAARETVLNANTDMGEPPEVEAENTKNDALLDAYLQYTDSRLSSGEDFNASQLQQSKEFAAAQAAIEEAQLNARLGIASKMFGNLGSLMSTENKKLFEIGKIAAISQAGIDGIAAGISSYKAGAAIGGPILGAAYAATSAISTGVMISQLASRSFGSGGAPAPAPSAAPPQATSTSAQSVGGGESQGGTLFVEGISEDTLLSGGMFNSIVSRLLQYQIDGGTVVI